jgi:hypothetical protein
MLILKAVYRFRQLFVYNNIMYKAQWELIFLKKNLHIKK